jgi:YggT family protein
VNIALRVVCILLLLYWVVLFVRILLSWFPPPQSGAGRVLHDVVFGITEPVLRLVRGLLPPVRMGAVGFDLSPILIFIVIGVLRQALGCGISF